MNDCFLFTKLPQIYSKHLVELCCSNVKIVFLNHMARKPSIVFILSLDHELGSWPAGHLAVAFALFDRFVLDFCAWVRNKITNVSSRKGWEADRPFVCPFGRPVHQPTRQLGADGSLLYHIGMEPKYHKIQIVLRQSQCKNDLEMRQRWKR